MEEYLYEEVMDFFEDYRKAFPLFRQVQEYLYSLGPVKMEVMKTQISFGSERKFAWVWLPQKWTVNRPATSLTVTFALNRQVVHEKIAQSVEVRPHHWTHHVVVKEAADFDEHVRSWLQEAYQWSHKYKLDQVPET